MKRTVVGAIAVVTALGVISAGGIGLASAASAPQAGMTSSAPMSLQNEGQVLKVLHDQLASAAKNGDVNGVQQAVNQLTVELAKLRSPQGRAAMSGSTANLVDQATAQNDQVNQALAKIEAGQPVTTKTAGAPSPQDLLPPLPGPLGAIGALLNSLLNTVLTLITGLLGTLPVPVPVPGVPSLPVSPPSVPSVAPPKA